MHSRKLVYASIFFSSLTALLLFLVGVSGNPALGFTSSFPLFNMINTSKNPGILSELDSFVFLPWGWCIQKTGFAPHCTNASPDVIVKNVGLTLYFPVPKPKTTPSLVTMFDSSLPITNGAVVLCSLFALTLYLCSSIILGIALKFKDLWSISTFIAALVSFAGMVVSIANVFGALIMYTNFATRLPNIILTYNMNTLSPKIVGSLGGFMFTISAGSGAILAVSAAVFGIISFICTFKTFSTRNAVGKVTPDVEAVEDYGDMRGEYKGGNMRRPSRTAGGRNERERYNVYEDDRYDNRQSYRTSFRPISEYHEEKPAETYYGSAQKAATSTANYFTSFFTAKPAEKEVNIPNSRESYDDFEPVQQRRPSATRRPINAGGRFREPEPSWKPKAKPQAKKSKWSIYSAQPSRDSYFN